MFVLGVVVPVLQAAGKVGIVTHIDTDSNVVVTFGQRGVLFAPASCMPAPGASQDTLPEVEPGPETRRNTAVKEEKKTQGDYAASTCHF